jgi:hypothetical protein
VGPGLAALIVALALRFRLSRARIQEFLGEWLGLELSLGTIHQTIHEASAAVAPAEEDLIQAVLDSDLLHADETPWPEHGRGLWLWVFIAATVTLYYVAGRGKELVENVLDGFTGWLMTDGWMAYRDSLRRLRCWAHLIRKARGLAQSSDSEARAFGQFVLDTLEVLMAAVYAARDGPPPVDLPTQHAPLLAALRAAGERRQDSPHQKTHALAVELLNDWEAIFQVLSHPELPLTNNEAERALRHWVILRKLSLGTRTEVGSRVVALLASVIDTCRQRGHSPWLSRMRYCRPARWPASGRLTPVGDVNGYNKNRCCHSDDCARPGAYVRSVAYQMLDRRSPVFQLTPYQVLSFTSVRSSTSRSVVLISNTSTARVTAT